MSLRQAKSCMSAFLRFQRTSQSTKPSIANTSRLAPRRVGLLWKESPSVASQNLQLKFPRNVLFEKSHLHPGVRSFWKNKNSKIKKKTQKMAGSHQPCGSETLGLPGQDSILLGLGLFLVILQQVPVQPRMRSDGNFRRENLSQQWLSHLVDDAVVNASTTNCQ